MIRFKGTVSYRSDIWMRVNPVWTADFSSACMIKEKEKIKEMMAEAPIVIEMSDYSGFEKVGPLGTSRHNGRQVLESPLKRDGMQYRNHYVPYENRSGEKSVVYLYVVLI